jgi:hypothetical protein
MKDTCKVKAHTRKGKKVAAHTRTLKKGGKKGSGDEYKSRRRSAASIRTEANSMVDWKKVMKSRDK